MLPLRKLAVVAAVTATGHAAAAALDVSLADSTCAKLLQQLGEDFAGVAVDALDGYAAVIDWDGEGLEQRFLTLVARQLVGRLIGISEAAHIRFGCASRCGACPDEEHQSAADSSWRETLRLRVTGLVKRLSRFAALFQQLPSASDLDDSLSEALRERFKGAAKLRKLSQELADTEVLEPIEADLSEVSNALGPKDIADASEEALEAMMRALSRVRSFVGLTRSAVLAGLRAAPLLLTAWADSAEPRGSKNHLRLSSELGITGGSAFSDFIRGEASEVDAKSPPWPLLVELAQPHGTHFTRPADRSHPLCDVDYERLYPNPAESYKEAYKDSSGAKSWHGASSASLMRRLERLQVPLSHRYYSFMPQGMPAVPCEDATGMLYDPTICLESLGKGWSGLVALPPHKGSSVTHATQRLRAHGSRFGARQELEVPWPPQPEPVDLLFLHPMSGNCVVLEEVFNHLGGQHRSEEDMPKLLYVPINPLLPPPLRAAPDFLHHWSRHEELSRHVVESQQEDMTTWVFRSMATHFLAQCSLAQAAAMLRPRGYELLHVEHVFAVFALGTVARSLRGEAESDDAEGREKPLELVAKEVEEFEAWRKGWFCSALAPLLLSLEQLASPEPIWLGISALPPTVAEVSAQRAVCDFLRQRGLEPDEVLDHRCELGQQSLIGEDAGTSKASRSEALQRRLRLQWALELPPPLPGVALQLSGSVSFSQDPRHARGHCPSQECECFVPWRGPRCDLQDPGSKMARSRDYASAIHYIVNEDPVHMAELRHSLRNLWNRYNSRFDHPVLIYHEGLSSGARASIIRASPNRIWFHRLPEDFLPPASLLPADIIIEDDSGDVSHHSFSAGYRAQCRFRSGPIFEHPAVSELDYLMSLDTDSILPSDVEVDPIQEMHENKSRVLGYAHLTMTSGASSRNLWPATLAFLSFEKLDLVQARKNKHHFFSRFLSPHAESQEAVLWNNAVVMTDLELMRVSFFKPGTDYFRYYRYMDELGGFWLHRWGDHAVRGLGAAIALYPWERPENESSTEPPPLMAYDLKMAYAHQGSCFCHDPALKCVKLSHSAAGEPLWPTKKSIWECVDNSSSSSSSSK